MATRVSLPTMTNLLVLLLGSLKRPQLALCRRYFVWVLVDAQDGLEFFHCLCSFTHPQQSYCSKIMCGCEGSVLRNRCIKVRNRRPVVAFVGVNHSPVEVCSGFTSIHLKE